MIDLEIPIGKRTPKYRFFEMLPALLSYGLLLTPVVLSFLDPLVAAVFIIGYIIIWFVKAIGIAYRTVQGYNLLQKAQKVDWYKRLNDLGTAGDRSACSEGEKSWGYKQHCHNLAAITSAPQLYYKPSEVYNLVIVPTYKEGREVLDTTIRSILRSHYDIGSNMIFVLAYEERAGEKDKKMAEDLVKKYNSRFYYATAIMHPLGIPYEQIGKGGNITYSARIMQKVLSDKRIDPDKVIVTTLDADNRPHPSYFAHVAYEYIISGARRRHLAFQPVSLYMSNIWDVPAPMRVLATGNSFWTIINSQRPHMLRNFSSHSQGMGALIDTDFWSVRTIVEDGHQYWRSYFRYDGDYDVVPIYVPIYQDAVLAGTYWQTMKAQFTQLRRWAYGASDVAYVADKGLRKDSKVPRWGFWGRFLRLLDSHVSWATASIIIGLGAWAPLFLSHESSRSIIAHELPLIASQLQQIALIGMFIMIFLTFKMLPPRPARYKAHRNIAMLLQWVIMPVTSICYGSAAAFNSQTRLLLGKYLDKFDVTVKAIKK
jgi:cellulose synthase/poly-beta-1,6-N-acetylglucosamine synthase-like glycosyltransferase